MSRQERTGVRDLTFSRWHRTLPDSCTCVDLDFLEYCQRCRAPLALLETAGGHHGQIKPTTVLRALAMTAKVPAYLVLYDLDPELPHGLSDAIRITRIAPVKSATRTISLDALGKFIARIHRLHHCP